MGGGQLRVRAVASDPLHYRLGPEGLREVS